MIDDSKVKAYKAAELISWAERNALSMTGASVPFVVGDKACWDVVVRALGTLSIAEVLSEVTSDPVKP